MQRRGGRFDGEGFGEWLSGLGGRLGERGSRKTKAEGQRGDALRKNAQGKQSSQRVRREG
jgi:hypothetical protein